ncbi:MAG: hypothetical protein ACFFD4_32650 [Candidatus Odinarchaeota archaeon]
MPEKIVHREIRPGKKRIKVFIIKLVMFILGRAIQSSSRFDRVVKEELTRWPEGHMLMFTVQPKGPSLALRTEKGMLKKIKPAGEPDTVVFIKNVESAFLLMTAQLGTVQAFIEHRCSLKGDVTIAMSLIRCLNRTQTYLFPRLIARRVLKKPASIPWYRRYWGRIRIYSLGIPLGI